jgi:hypothetical protein
MRDTRNRERTARRFGEWSYDPADLTLTHAGGYDIDLERCSTSAEMLDWIFQIASKTWCSPITLAGLVRAFDELLHPQGYLCSSGVERGPIDVAATIRAATS